MVILLVTDLLQAHMREIILGCTNNCTFRAKETCQQSSTWSFCLDIQSNGHGSSLDMQLSNKCLIFRYPSRFPMFPNYFKFISQLLTFAISFLYFESV